jgi:hypothetical protein
LRKEKYMGCPCCRYSKIACLIAGVAGLIGLWSSPWVEGDAQPNAGDAAAKSREFDFTYLTTVTGLRPGQVARIWLPVPPSSGNQEITEVTRKVLLGAKSQINKEPKYHNSILYVEGAADGDGNVPIVATYHVKRREVKADLSAMKDDMADLELYLRPDVKVPIGGKPLSLLEGKPLPSDQLEMGRLLYNIVDDHMRYSKEGTGWGNGDAEWACDSKFGNCSDFHSLFISLARSKEIPAKFEMGFPLPEKRGAGDIGGYHCWAMFKPKGKGWIPVDISEANKNPKMRDYYFGNLTENRVTFSEGRDITLVPRQDGPPLNFFIYPYVEVEGKPYAADKVTRKFSFCDVGAER